MSKISIKSFANEKNDVLIFNDGKAGRVEGVTIGVRKRTPEDDIKTPDYKILFFDENEASVNLGVYYPKDTTSDKEISIRMGQLVDILSVVDPDLDLDNLPEFDNYKAAYDFLCTSIMKKCKGVKANIFVAYGTKRRPSRFLEFRAYNIIEPADTPAEKSRLFPVNHREEEKSIYNDLMTRIEPTEESTSGFGSGASLESSEDDWDDE